MRFHVGPVPESPDFHPAETGWTPLREPSPIVISLAGGVVGLGLGAAAIAIWSFVPGLSFKFHMSGGPGDSMLLALAVVLGKVLLGVALLIVVHELLHAAVFPGMWFSPRTIIGAWPSRGVFYAGYDGAMSRNRWLLVYAMPSLVLTFGILALEANFRTGWGWLPAWSILNAFFAGGDALGILLIAWQVPAKAEVRNQGWNTWWRVADQGT
jgi:hypothetical protein